MHLGLGVIIIAAFVLGFAKSFSLREAFEETVWFTVAYMVALAVIFLLEQVGYGFLSTSPTGAGGAVALLIGFVAMWVRHNQWRKEKARKKAAKDAERARRVAAGLPAQPSLVSEAFRFAGSVNRARKSQRTEPE
jgi:protein-S-isoprenylcysteine O-methyltransferase Ste14